ncbi:MAG: helix-turn-helix transcriptional regulator [Phycisphaerae bacterium]
MSRIVRVVRLLQILHPSKPVPIETLCQELGVARRTIFRDLKILQQAGLSCRFDKQRHGYVLGCNPLLPPVDLNLTEALVMMLLAGKAARSRIVPHRDAARAAALKIEAVLPPHLVRHCGELLAKMDLRYWPTSDLDSVTDLFDKLQLAVAQRRIVVIRYDSYYEGDEILTRLHIYRLTFIRRAWYAIGFSQRHQEVRTFKLERMLETNVLEETYEMDQDFNLDEYFGNAWQMIRGTRTFHVVIRFSQMVAGNVEEVFWHKTQRLTRRPDGSLIFEADVDGAHEIAWWVLGYGKEAMVIEPPELRNIIIEHVASLANRYGLAPDASQQAES